VGSGRTCSYGVFKLYICLGWTTKTEIIDLSKLSCSNDRNRKEDMTDEFVNPITGTEGLEAIMEEAIANSVWETQSVDSEPEVILDQWQVFESPVGRHFMGYSERGREGRVSSPIVTFDKEKMRGVTRSGRVYQLTEIGPGFNADAEYVLSNWLRRNGWTRDDVEYITI